MRSMNFHKFDVCTDREDCELKRTDIDACIFVFVPNPSLSCTVFLFCGFGWIEKSNGGMHGDPGIGGEGIGPAV